MNKNNKHGYLISLDICILCAFFLCRTTCGAHYQYEACVPKNCGNGPNISFPFYIPGLQEPYCGYPGFIISCTENGFPFLHFPENDYVVEDIFYRNRSFRGYNAAVSGLSSGSCVPRIRNTTIPSMFEYVNTRSLHLFSNCTRLLSEGLLRYNVSCDAGGGENNWDLALYDGDENLRNATENCETSVVAPVESDENNIGIGDFVGELRRGFVLNWRASDCNTCEDSGGHCGFNETTFHFRCFCLDRPHSRSCKPGQLFSPD